MALTGSLAGWRLLAGKCASGSCRRAAPLAAAGQRPRLASRSSSSGAAATEQAAGAEPAGGSDSSSGGGDPSSSGSSSASLPPPGPGVRSNVVATLRARGLIQDVSSPELERAALRAPLAVYCGFDPTAESLHLGNLLGIMVLRWFQASGHTPVALLGGATGRVGDPSGKSAERPVLSDSDVERNTAGIEANLRALLAPPPGSGLPHPVVVNNLDWLGAMPLLTFLRDVGKQARVGTMISKESVRRRLDSEQGISFTEFAYQLLQGYDFVHLARTAGVRVQVGGSDQWGNIIAGTDLIRRMLEGDEPSAAGHQGSQGGAAGEGGSTQAQGMEQCYGLTFPLLLKADGSKFGKSESGALWLSSSMLSPYKFYQAIFQTADVDVARMLRALTALPLEEIEAVEASMREAGYEANSAQRLLAEEVTRMVHGDQGLDQALKATQALAPGATTMLDASALEAIAGDAPSASLPRGEVVGAPLCDVMAAVGMQPSRSAVRRMIKGGGVRLNNARVDDELYVLAEGDLIDGRLALIAAGKKNKLLLRVEG